MFKKSIFFCVLPFLSFAECVDFPNDQNLFYYSRLEIGYSAGKFIGIDKDYGEIGLFVPLLASNDIFSFWDAKYYKFANQWGGSLGLGARALIYDEYLLGVNLYYDYLKRKRNVDFGQLGIGLEWLGCDFDIRINGLIPAGSQAQFSGTTIYLYSTGYAAICHSKDFSYATGISAELGYHIGCFCDFNVYTAAGPYFYSHKGNDGFFGGYARFEVNWSSYVGADFRASYDHKNHFQAQGQVHLDFPLDFLFNPCCEYSCLGWLLQSVERNGIILIDDCCNYDWNW